MKNKAEIFARMHHHRIDALMKLAPVTLSAGIIAAMLIVVIYWHTAARPAVSLWFGIYSVINIVRYGMVKRFNKLPAENRNHARILNIHLVFSAIAGAFWAAISIYILNMFAAYETLYILLILGGLVAVALATNVIILSAYFSFILPATIPLIVFLLFQSNTQLVIFSFILSIYIVFISFGAIRMNSVVTESITYHFENLQLLENLEKEKNQVAALYSNLEYDLAERMKIEEKLMLEKERAEELARSLIAISTLDGLTGIPNRRHFDSTLAKEWNRATRSSTPISLIMCDIDYFKSYNDNYGHQKGDNCLIQIANLLQEHARRDDDMAARYGGEEFAIILPATGLENAKEIAEQMRIALLDLCIRHRFSETDNIVTASFGVATIVPQRDQPSKHLVSRADKALYMAKEQGRNRVVAVELQGLDNEITQDSDRMKA